uniref:Uncharacterized protein n=1 Tax=Anguilla anguilla TaxID=7936 RepID=A0A0E9S6M1_ANGAN
MFLCNMGVQQVLLSLKWNQWRSHRCARVCLCHTKRKLPHPKIRCRIHF